MEIISMYPPSQKITTNFIYTTREDGLQYLYTHIFHSRNLQVTGCTGDELELILQEGYSIEELHSSILPPSPSLLARVHKVSDPQIIYES